MKNLAWIAAYVAWWIGVTALVLVACGSTARREAAATELRRELDTILAARGIVTTPAEQERLQQRLVDLEGASGFDWAAVGSIVGGLIGLAVPILRIIPNRFLIGTAEAAALDRACSMAP